MFRFKKKWVGTEENYSKSVNILSQLQSNLKILFYGIRFFQVSKTSILRRDGKDPNESRLVPKFLQQHNIRVFRQVGKL